MTVTVLVLQSWFDLAVQHTGSVMNAYELALANGDRSVTDDPISGEQIIIPSNITILKKETVYLKSKTAILATGITKGQLDQLTPPIGIGTMIVGSTFIVD
ncbi:hypothetical protein QWY99_22190 [Flavobacterium branchiarum]|uniref:hypothetical protein n=1 Tax=Flavobacterium branchiarum TaxID=1114870 RepID=UPI0025B284B7|nr:hypothetical protein [Flavobacterium branchiarum]MDN3671515.1 hypothetical protein [Flavobacterium branchiarum]MDN3675748.1 hypothetical protein [Flavobacterium branchiarum]